jgi:hypothetical protein
MVKIVSGLDLTFAIILQIIESNQHESGASNLFLVSSATMASNQTKSLLEIASKLEW